jgi:hypothetical protein
MAFEAKVFRILVASPGDVGEERNVIPEIINEWNAVNAFAAKILLMPVKWETHSAPLLGDRPQGIINTQLVKDCDLLVGVFWTRIGTNTGVAVSGTAEEIGQFVDSKKPVMLYFSQTPVDPDRIEIDQFTILKTFKERMRVKGLTESYQSISDFKQKFARQLSINIGNVLTPSVEKKEATKTSSKRSNLTRAKSPTTLLNKINPIGTINEKLTSDKVDEYLTKAVQSVANDPGWARLAAVGLYLQTYTPVNYHDFGNQKLKDFLKSRKLFEFKEQNGHPILKVAQPQVKI